MFADEMLAVTQHSHHGLNVMTGSPLTQKCFCKACFRLLLFISAPFRFMNVALVQVAQWRRLRAQASPWRTYSLATLEPSWSLATRDWKGFSQMSTCQTRARHRKLYISFACRGRVWRRDDMSATDIVLVEDLR